jgi:hypothetical protein
VLLALALLHYAAAVAFGVDGWRHPRFKDAVPSLVWEPLVRQQADALAAAGFGAVLQGLGFACGALRALAIGRR